MANVKEEAKTRALQVQFQNAKDVWEWTSVDVPVELDADEVVERVREFVPEVPEVPFDDWLVAVDSRERIFLRQTPKPVTATEVRQATEVVRYELEKATTRAYAREFGIPDGYQWGEKRRLTRDLRVVVPVRYSDGVEEKRVHVTTLDFAYKIGERRRIPFRLNLTVDGLELPWPGPVEQLTPAELEARFGDHVPGVPEIEWPQTICLDIPSPGARLAAVKKAKARDGFVPNEHERLSEAELQEMQPSRGRSSGMTGWRG